MDHDTERIRAIFDQIMEAPADPEIRRRLLDERCGNDAVLRQQVEALVAAAEAGGSFLSDPTQEVNRPGAHSTAAFAAINEPVGSRIGPYKLLELIGEGGFGAVYVAEQDKPVRRRVALKVIKLGMDTKQVIARFEAERQALAMMDHPNIAKVLDAGATESGRPWFAMELVRGVPITEYCDAANLTAAERLELFTQVCHAVQHAHQKGVIHRDIKPSNVLVTLHDGKPVPKVIDFGIAKAVGAQLTDKTVYTLHRQMIGTPAYMSPEQAEMSGLDVDTRADVYSLGVLMYELLTGSPPFAAEELFKAGLVEMQRIIREVEPVKPSTRVNTLGETLPTVAARRSVEAKRLGVLLRGDLDWIAMKCLEKDRARRYETANALADDVKRHLGGEPVVAAPPSAAYRLRKFVRKHRGPVIAGSAVAAVLVLGIVGTTSQWLRAKQFYIEAEHQAHVAGANAASAFLAKQEAEQQRDEAEKARGALEAANAKVAATVETARLALGDVFGWMNRIDLIEGVADRTYEGSLDGVPAKVIEKGRTTTYEFADGSKQIDETPPPRDDMTLGGWATIPNDDVDVAIRTMRDNTISKIREAWASQRSLKAANAEIRQAFSSVAEAAENAAKIGGASGIDPQYPMPGHTFNADGSFCYEPSGNEVIEMRDTAVWYIEDAARTRTKLEAANAELREQVKRAELAEADVIYQKWPDSETFSDPARAIEELRGVIAIREKHNSSNHIDTVKALWKLSDAMERANNTLKTNHPVDAVREDVAQRLERAGAFPDSELLWRYAVVSRASTLDFDRSRRWITRISHALPHVAHVEGPESVRYALHWLSGEHSVIPRPVTDLTLDDVQFASDRLKNPDWSQILASEADSRTNEDRDFPATEWQAQIKPQCERIVDLANQMLAESADRPCAHAALAAAYRSLGKPETALAEATLALDSPLATEAWQRVMPLSVKALALHDLGRSGEALAALGEARTLMTNADSSKYYIQRGLFDTAESQIDPRPTPDQQLAEATKQRQLAEWQAAAAKGNMHDVLFNAWVAEQGCAELIAIMPNRDAASDGDESFDSQMSSFAALFTAEDLAREGSIAWRLFERCTDRQNERSPSTEKLLRGAIALNARAGMNNFVEGLRDVLARTQVAIAKPRSAIANARINAGTRPDNARYQTTLAMVCYANLLYDDAIRAAGRSSELHAHIHDDEQPVNLAIIAMSHHKLGHAAEARAAFDKLQELMAKPEFANDKDCQMLYTETRDLLEPAATPPVP